MEYYYKSVSEDGSVGYLCISTNYKKLPQGYERITKEQFEQAIESLKPKAK